MKRELKLNKAAVAAIMIAALSGLIILCFTGGVFDYWEYKTYDLRVKLFAESTVPSEEIIVVLLDQNSIDWAKAERNWGWPWPRKAYGEFVNYMNAGGAKSVAFDVIFSEPSVYRNADQDAIIDRMISSLNLAESGEQEQAPGSRQAARPGGSIFREVIGSLRELNSREDDAFFARAEQDSGRVVQTVVFSTQTGNAETWPADLNKPLFTLHNFEQVISRFDLVREEGNVMAQFPIPELRNAAGAIGNVTGVPDSDSVLRRIRLFTLFDNKAVPGLSAASLLVSGQSGELSFDPAKQAIDWGEYRVPIDKEGKTILRFRGSLDRYIPYSASAILKSAEAYAAGDAAYMESDEFLPPENFKDKYIFFGYYAQGLFDIFNTPISSVYPGMGMHITMLDNLLQGDFIRESPLSIDILIILLSVMVVVILALFVNKIPVQVSITLLVFAAIIALGLGAYQAAGLWVPIAAPLIAAVLAFLTVMVYQYATEGSKKRFIQSAFSRYLSPTVIEQLIADPSKLTLGGERREMTAIFTDIQRFSSISSELQDEYGEDGPKVLVNLLNLYLTDMSNIVLANQGTIDKYEGDAIIAFFGAPLQVPNHASLACHTALQMKKGEIALREKIMQEGSQFYPAMRKLVAGGAIRKERPIYTRVGLNTGDMVVGNMGTPSKMDYTIMGNAVNLAARLEGVNKQYDTHGILISEYTKDRIGDEFVIRPLSRVTVVGIPTPLRLFELLETKAEAPQEMLDMTGIWQKAMDSYEAKDFKGALKLFQGLFQADETDFTARLYIKRCEKYLKDPPPKEWDGVDNLTEK